MGYLANGGESEILNCGYGQGCSVRKVLNKLQKITEIDFPVVESPRRAGDPACVISSGDRLCQVLGWQPKYNNLEIILSTT
nr:hypothetical protein [Pleurocapsa sp. FMAR1]